MTNSRKKKWVLHLGIVFLLLILYSFYAMIKSERLSSRYTDISGKLSNLRHKDLDSQFDYKGEGFLERKVEGLIVRSKRVLVQGKEIEIGVIQAELKDAQKLFYSYDPYLSEIRIASIYGLNYKESHVGGYESALDSILIYFKNYTGITEEELQELQGIQGITGTP